MKIDVLREFLCLAEELNFSETAKRFFISQSVLSRHIQDLECELGCSLFLRNKSSVRLTAMGKYLADNARELVDMHDRLIDGIKYEIGKANSALNVGYLKGASGWFLSGACKLFKRERPATSISVRSLQPDQILESLKKDEIDIGITIWPKERNSSLFEFAPIYRDRFAVMMDKEHPLASHEEISPSQLPGKLQIPESFPHEAELAAMLRSRLDSAGIEYETSHAIDDIDSVPILFENKSWTMLTCEHLKKQYPSDFKMLPLSGIDLEYEVVAAWKKSRHSEALDCFVSCLLCCYEMVSRA